MNIQDFDFSVDILRALLWRNNEAVNIQSLLEFKQAYFDENNVDFWTDWYNDVFNLDTANLFGLKVWAIILNFPITVESEITPEVANSNFGFGEFRKNFNHGNFSALAGQIIVSLEEARQLLKLRYYQLTVNGNPITINQVLENVFGNDGLAVVVDNLDMTMVYVFKYQLSPTMLFALESLDVLPRPAGVKSKVVVELPNTNFGFGEFRQNFNNGNFTSV